MAGSTDVTVNGTSKHRIALFGPQITKWTYERIIEVQTVINNDSDLVFLAETLARLPSLWPTLENLPFATGIDGKTKLEELQNFANGKNNLDLQRLTNTHLAPLTVVSHVIDLFRIVKDSKQDDGLPEFEAAQGFCIGFLSATALASSKSWIEFKGAISNSLRLAACLGIIIDAQEASGDELNHMTAISVRWKKDSERTYLETCLDQCPDAYISCITDVNTLTVTLPSRDRKSFCSRLRQGGIALTAIGLDGSYHHAKHAQSAKLLRQLCDKTESLKLPDASQLSLPLRSTSDAEIISSGSLHHIAIDNILCKRAHWFQTIKSTVRDIPLDKFEFVPFGGDSCIPRSLLPNQQSALTNGILHKNLPTPIIGSEEIAVVGMACRYPGADSVEEYWQLISSGKTSFGKLPEWRFKQTDVTREPKLANFWGNFLKHPDVFDHRFFEVSGREAKSMDPQQRLALQVAYEALESAGYCSSPVSEKKTDVGCYLGVGAVEYEANVASEDANAFSALGTLRSFISGRISHFFGWEGPSITFDTACSSSAVAIHTACKALLGGECSLALAGGVNVITSPDLHQNLAAASFLNPNGSSKAFDAQAGGYCRGEGAGMLFLKPLSKAVADGDSVIGVIAASAVNQGSNSSPITVPDSHSQSSLYKKVLSAASIEPSDVTFVEAHGTGTPVGDPIEYESVRLALTGSSRSERLFLGSVKDNIGHTEAASGAAAVIKTLLMMQHETIPKQANFESLNSRIQHSPLDKIDIPKTTQPWVAQRPLALVNNYGAAGSNAAIILRRHQDPSSGSRKVLANGQSSSAADVYPIMISAKSENSVKMYLDTLKTSLSGTKTPVADIAYNMARRSNPSLDFRTAFTASDVKDIAYQDEPIITRTGKQPVVMAFGGQTGNLVTVSKDFYDSCDLFRKHLDDCDMICQKFGLPSIYPHIFRDEPIGDIVALHCMLLSLQVSSGRCWLDSGLEIDTLIGHSFGQLAALCVADSITLEDTFRLVSGRARLIRDVWGLERGLMLSVEAAPEEIDVVIDIVNALSGLRVEVACHNGPRSFVLAGDTASMARVEEECKGYKTTRLRSTHAYHSYVADGILSDLRHVAESIEIRPPRIHIETCSANGNWSQFTAEEIVQHTRQPVYFVDAVERLSGRLRSAVWLEAGSNTPIVAMARRIIHSPKDTHTFIPMDISSSTAGKNLADATCKLWSSGSSVQHWLFHDSSKHRYGHLTLPPYQFEQVHHWIDYKPKSKLASSMSPQDTIIKEPSLVELIQDGADTGEYLFQVDTSYHVFELGCQGHAVAGQSLCPASMYIEIATRCAMAIASTESLDATPPHIENLSMSAPLGLDNALTVFMRFSRRAAKNWNFVVISQQSKDKRISEDATEHAKGQINLVPAGSSFVESRLSLLERFAKSSRADRILDIPSATGISGPIVYELFSEVVDYADYYRGVQSVSALDHEAVGHVFLPRDPLWGMSSVVCDPIPLDNFLQVAGVHVNRLSPRKKDEVFMCTAVDEIILSETFVTDKSESRTWTVYSQYDRTSKVDVLNNILVYEAASKCLVVAIMGARFHSVPLKVLARTLTRLNTATHTGADVSETNSEHMDDSGYQSYLPTPADDGYPKGPVIPSSLPTQPIAGKTQKAPRNESLVEVHNDSSDVIHQIRKMFSEILEVPINEIEPITTLNDLGIDSLLVTEVLAEISKRFRVSLTQGQFQECSDVLSLGRRIQPTESVDSDAKSITTLVEDTLDDPRSDTASPLTVKSDRGRQDEPKSNVAFNSRESFLQVRRLYDDYANETAFANFSTDVFPLQSQLVQQYVVEAFEALGCNLGTMKAGEDVRLPECKPNHTKLVRQLFRILESGGLVEQKNDSRYHRTSEPVPQTPANVLHNCMLDRFAQHASETRLLYTTAHRLADCLVGKADPLALIFRDSAARSLLEDVYTNAPMFRTGSLLLAQYLTSSLERIDHDREIRILELGAGTGGTTKHLVESLAGLGGKRKFSYTFTDLSSSLVAAARRKFAKLSFMEYAVLDIEQEPGNELIGAYDIIVSINCIHATQSLVKSTTNIRRMLRPDGVVCLVELTRNLFWFDLVFGLLEGWWLFKDGRDHALADEWRWKRDLQIAGFQWVDWTDSETKESDILRVVTASPYHGLDSPSTRAITDRIIDMQGMKADQSRETVVFKKVDGLDLHADIYYPPETSNPMRPLPVAT